jgi:hypothetical protein
MIFALRKNKKEASKQARTKEIRKPLDNRQMKLLKINILHTV